MGNRKRIDWNFDLVDANTGNFHDCIPMTVLENSYSDSLTGICRADSTSEPRIQARNVG